MTVLIGHASSDERGKYSGGQAGEQNGREVYTREYYDRPFLVVIRPKSEAIAEKIATAMEEACANSNIGYDQYQRTTLYTEAKKVGFNLSKVMTPCETDCSALVAVCVNAAGIPVSKDIYTGNEEQALLKTNQFDVVYKSSSIGADPSILKRGDILLYPYHHTAVALSDGSGNENGWVQRNGRWFYYRDGKLLKKEWIIYKNRKYRVGNDGAMLTDWHQIYDEDGVLGWYYFDSNGVLWHETGKKNGSMEEWVIEEE